MLAKHFKRTIKTNKTAMWRMFSAESAPEQKSSIPEPSAAEKETARHEWGLKYDDECLKFEKEWEIIAKKV